MPHLNYLHVVPAQLIRNVDAFGFAARGFGAFGSAAFGFGACGLAAYDSPHLVWSPHVDSLHLVPKFRSNWFRPMCFFRVRIFSAFGFAAFFSTYVVSPYFFPPHMVSPHGFAALGSAAYGFAACGSAACGSAAFSCTCLLYTSPSPRDGLLSRMPSSA